MPDNGFRLLTLGRLALVGPAGDADDALNTRRRKVALLAVLALTRPGGTRRPVSRDALVEMFWGDQDEVRARHSLSDAISHLRRVIGREAITTTRSEAALSPDAALTVDAVELANAVARRDYAQAVALYEGPFLDGVYVGGSPSFEQWVARERGRLEALFLQACDKECLALARARRWEECAAVAGRWLEAAPLSADAALYLMNALKAPGTREAERRALQAYDRLAARLSREFELAPDASVTSLAEGIRTRLATAEPRTEPRQPSPDRATTGAGTDAPTAPRPGAAPGAAPAVSTAEPARDARPSPLSPPRSPPAPRERPAALLNGPPVPVPAGRPQRAARATPFRLTPRTSPRLGGRRAIAIGALAAGVLVGAAALTLWRPRQAAPTVSPTAVAVLPFAVHGGDELAYLRAGMVDLLSTNLDGAGGLRSMDPRAVLAVAGKGEQGDAAIDLERGRALARRLGAGSYVLGDLVQAGQQIRINASLYYTGGIAPVAVASAEGDPDQLFRLVDRLTAQLLVARLEGSGERMFQIAAMTTHSIPALKAYLEGETHWRAVRFAESIEALQRAVAIDSTFALAWYRLGVALSWEGRIDVARHAMDRAMRYRGSLSDRDRRLVEAYYTLTRRVPDEFERHYRAIIADYPTDMEAWSGLGESWFHGNPVRGRSFTESRRAWEHVLRFEPDNGGVAWHLSQVAARERRYGELDSLITRLLATSSGGAALSLRVNHAVTLGDRAAQEKLVPELRAADDYTLIISVWRAAVFSHDPSVVARYARLLTEPARLAEVQAVGRALLAHLELAQGRWRRAQAELAALEAVHPAWAVEYGALLAAAPFLPTPPAQLAAERERVRRWNAAVMPRIKAAADLWVNANAAAHPQHRLYLLGLLSARLGDDAAARHYAAELAARTGSTDEDELARHQARNIRAQLLWRRGETREALRVMASSPNVVDFGFARASPFYSLTHDRFSHAELLHALGRDDEALGWYRGLAEIFPFDLPYLAPAELRQAEIYEQRGDRKAAAEHYARFIELWKECDPELRPMLEEAERRLAALR